MQPLDPVIPHRSRVADPHRPHPDWPHTPATPPPGRHLDGLDQDRAWKRCSGDCLAAAHMLAWGRRTVVDGSCPIGVVGPGRSHGHALRLPPAASVIKSSGPSRCTPQTHCTARGTTTPSDSAALPQIFTHLAYTSGLRRTSAEQTGLSCSVPDRDRRAAPHTPERPAKLTRNRGARRTWPSP